IVFVQRSVDAIGDPLDPIEFSKGGDLMTLVPGTPSGKLRNLTADLTNGQGDVSDPEIFPQTRTDQFRLTFSMRKSSADRWHLYEMTVNADGSRVDLPKQLTCGPNNDVDPAFLPDGRIVFSSDRPGHLDEYERRKSALLHILDPAKPALPSQPLCASGGKEAGEVVQISFNQSHERNPTVLKDGTIMFSRWEHLGNVNKFTIFKIEPDGTDLFVKYGSHSGVNSFLDVRERADGKLTATMMPLSGTFEGGAIGILDAENEADNAETASQQLIRTQVIPTGREASGKGRYHSVYQVPDGTNRYLAAYSVGRVVTDMGNNVREEPSYGIWMVGADGISKPIKLPQSGSRRAFLEPIPLMAVSPDQIPTAKPAKAANRSAQGVTGVLGAASVYDSEAHRALSNTVLGVTIPRGTDGQIDFDTLIANPAKQAVKEVRVIEAVPSMPGTGRRDIGSTNFERQKILGYAPVEPDGSFRVTVPADTSVTLNVVDSERRSFKVKENWLQVRPGENKTCNGCHSPRRGDPQRLAVDAIALNRLPSTLTPPAVPVIDYVDHVQALFTAKCTTACHEVKPGVSGPDGDLDLTGNLSGVGFTLSYDQLVGNMNGPALVRAGESRQSHLIERVFGEELRAAKAIPAVDPNNHAGILTPAERLTLVEWIDLGAQFTNKAVISQTGRANLNRTVFETSVLPIMTARCGICHVAGGDSDFVLTGSAEGDFGAVAARTNITTPENSLLLMKATGAIPMGLPGATVSPAPLSPADADYTTIRNWIAAAQP
ncbi:MAG: hypothetical protein ACE5F7_07465, partial [Nitrospiria bacterium]